MQCLDSEGWWCVVNGSSLLHVHAHRPANSNVSMLLEDPVNIVKGSLFLQLGETVVPQIVMARTKEAYSRSQSPAETLHSTCFQGYVLLLFYSFCLCSVPVLWYATRECGVVMRRAHNLPP